MCPTNSSCHARKGLFFVPKRHAWKYHHRIDKSSTGSDLMVGGPSELNSLEQAAVVSSRLLFDKFRWPQIRIARN